jgi:hypothetical protein
MPIRGNCGARVPVANVAQVAEPAKNFLMILKDGRIYKNCRRRV